MKRSDSTPEQWRSAQAEELRTLYREANGRKGTVGEIGEWLSENRWLFPIIPRDSILEWWHVRVDSEGCRIEAET